MLSMKKISLVRKNFVKHVPEPTVPECRKEADVVFVIDSTSNLLEKDFQLYILGTIAEIIQHLDVDSGRTRVAAVYFTDTPKVHYHHSCSERSKSFLTFKMFSSLRKNAF